jgi:DNA-binding winged helix-turn-helix (wHTH) protein
MNDTGTVRRAREISLPQEAPFDVADTRVSPAALEVEHAARVVALEPRVMKVLVALHRANGQPVSRDELTALCWGGRVVTDGALNRCIAQLRKALSADARIQLETIATVGYRLQEKRITQPATASALQSEEVLRPPHPSAGQAGSSTAPTSEGPVPSKWGTRKLWLQRLGAAAFLLAIVAAPIYILQRPAKWAAVAYRPLTSAPDFETFPALSPNGDQIVYASAPDGYSARDLYLRNADQGTPVQITSDENDDYGAAWSPTGDRVAFVRSFTQGPCTVLVVPVPRGPERVVARCQAAAQTRPSWLDAHTLVFSDQAGAQAISRIRAVDVETGTVRDLTSPPASTLGDAEPQASPDGRYIAFRRTLTIGADDLFMLDVLTGEECALTTDGWKAGG